MIFSVKLPFYISADLYRIRLNFSSFIKLRALDQNSADSADPADSAILILKLKDRRSLKRKDQNRKEDFAMNNYIRVIFIFIGVFHLTAGQFGGSQFGTFGCECSDFTYFNGVETVGQCLSGFCYVHMPTACFDRIESENFRGFQNPDGTPSDGSMYISFEACRRRLFGGSFGLGLGPLVNPDFGKEIIVFSSEVHSFHAACHLTTKSKHEAE